MRMYKFLIAFIASSISIPSLAQSEGGLLMEVGAEKKINRQVSISLEGDIRTRNNFKTMDRWSIGVGADYKFNKYLKASAGYILLNNNNREKISYNSSGEKKAWRPSYWGIRHRFNAALTGS